MKKVLLFLLLIGISTTANADTLTLQPGPTEGKDVVAGTVYYQENAGDYEGIGIGGWGDYYASYLEFDLSSIPTDSVVSSAILTLHESTTDRNFNNFRYTNIVEPWSELEVSNLNRPGVSSTTSEWTSMATSSSQSMIMTDLVQDWVSGLLPNYGFRIEAQYDSDNHARWMYSSDYLDNPTLRPKLVVEYTVPTSTISEFITLSEDVMTEISNSIEYAAVLPVYEDLMVKVVRAYENGKLVRADRRLTRFQTFISDGLGKLLFTQAERRAINTIIKDMKDILVAEG